MGIMDRIINRPNRVPHYQRLFYAANKNNIRWWNVSPRSKYMLYPYYILMAGSTAGSLYMMGRMVLGHKTWW